MPILSANIRETFSDSTSYGDVAARIGIRLPRVGLKGADMRSFSYVALFAALFLTGCPQDTSLECAVDTNCDLGVGGVCTLATTGNQWCAYPDETCPAGYRYSDNAGDDLGADCVEGTRYTLTVEVGGNGRGEVSTESGFSCSVGTCTGKFPEGKSIDLSAIPTEGTFLGWSDACRGPGACTITMDRNQIVRALFGTPGESLWALQLGSAGVDNAARILVDSKDNIVAVGEFGGRMMLNADTILESSGERDIYAIKLASATGQVLWVKRFGNENRDLAWNAAIDSYDGIYISGTFQGRVDLGTGPLESTSGSQDGFVLKLKADGAVEWVQQLPGTGVEYPDAIAINGPSVTVTGRYTGRMTVATAAGPTSITSANSSGGYDAFVINMSTMGVATWVKSLTATGVDANINARGTTIDSGGNVVIVGDYRGNLPGVASYGNDDVFLLKLAGSNGSTLLLRHFGGTGRESGRGVAVDSANNIFITGEFSATADFSCGNVLTASKPDAADVFLVKYTPAGACMWVKDFTGTYGAGANDVTVNKNDEVAFTGGFCGSMSLGGETLSSASLCPMGDVFAARYSNAGLHFNSARAGGAGQEAGSSIVQASDGRFFVVGSFVGFAEFGSNLFYAVGGDDAFVLALAPL